MSNVLAQIRYDTIIVPKSYLFVNQTSSLPYYIKYIEVLFDSVITVNTPVFYLTITFSTVNKVYDPYNHSFGCMYRQKRDCNNREFPLLIGGVEGGWRPLIQSYIENSNDPRIQDSSWVPYEMLVFPILNRKTSSLDEIDIDNKVEVYPNPSSKEINISSQYIINSIEILSTLGQKVYKEKINTTNKTIDISALNKGIYIIELKTEKGVIHKKFIKE